MPIEQPTINQLIETAPKPENQEQEELSFEQMKEDEENTIREIKDEISKKKPISEKAIKRIEALGLAIILTTGILGGTKQAEAKEFSWGQLGKAGIGLILKRGVEKIEKRADNRLKDIKEIQRTEEKIKEIEAKIRETKKDRHKELRALEIEQKLDKKEFELRNPQAAKEKNKLFEFKQKRKEIELRQKWEGKMTDLNFQLDELKSELSELRGEKTEKEPPEGKK